MRRQLIDMIGLSLAFSCVMASGDDFAIECFSGNGELAWNDTFTSGHFRVEWSPSLATNWRWDWDQLVQVPATGGVVRVSVPMLFRVVHFPPQVVTGATELRLVPGGGQFGGPSYSFYMAKYEVTQIEFLSFLNDAQANPSNARGSNMYFDVNGDIYMETNKTYTELLFDISNSDLIYNKNFAPGSRYSAFPDRTNHPITGVSWYGAAKFCNWLTIQSGRGEEHRCFSEGTSPTNWHPANVTYAEWVDGYDNAERIDLVNNWHGFRLPMDDYAAKASYFNEFYKAAAWNGSTNLDYAFGRTSVSSQDANYYNSGDPFGALVIQTTPVGYYDGSNHDGTFQTTAEANQYGLYDLCGNVLEYVLDTDYSGNAFTPAVTRGGSWVFSTSFPSSGLKTSFRDSTSWLPSSGSGPMYKYETTHNVGFRVVTSFP